MNLITLSSSVKRSFIYFLLISLLTGCNYDNSKHAMSSDDSSSHNLIADTFYLCDKLVHIDTITKTIFEKIANAKTILAQEKSMNHRVVQRSGDTLSIVTTKGIRRLIDINANNDSASKYLYQYFDSDISQHVVLGTFYEWYYYPLIDKNTGDTTYTCGLPVVSPNKQYFICGNTDLEAGETFNGFQLYQNTSPPKLLCERPLEKWGPETIKWIDATSLLIEAKLFDSTGVRPIVYD